MIGRSLLANWAAAVALACSRPAVPDDRAFRLLLPCETGGGSGPVHRRGRFKANQRKQRKGAR